MRRFSIKRQKQNREYSKLRVSYLEANPECQARISEDCQARANQIHHKFGRVGKNLVNLSGFIAVCDDCHKKIEASPKWAKSLGLSANRLT